MKPAVTIAEGDIDTVVALSRQIPEFTDPYGAEIYSSRLEGKPHLILLAYAEGRPIGFKVGYERHEIFYSWMGGVLPSWRRKGVATALADAQEEWARDSGYDKIRLKTRNRHTDMLVFALRRGFHILSVEPHEPVAEFRIWMEKAL